MQTLTAGEIAPLFCLPDQDGTSHSLDTYLGRKVLIYFYPKASTPGCTTQACGLRDTKSELEALNIVILGISPDTSQRLQNFMNKQALNFTLLADEDHSVADAYGVWGEKSSPLEIFYDKNPR